MDFAFLFYPPEINSTRMYTGPGSGSLLAAAGCWDSLSAELGITAETYKSVLTALTGLHWRGPAAQSMSATAAPYMAWLYATAEQAQQTAMQARAAAAAYELAHAMTVPPLAVAANRAQLAMLIATNFFGQNTAAIAFCEAQYGEYWAQDAAAMYGYASGATAATTMLPAFSAPRQTTNESGLTAQNAAVNNAVNNATTSVSQAVSAAAGPVEEAADPTSEGFSALDAILAVGVTFNGLADTEGCVEAPIEAMNDLQILPRFGTPATTPSAPSFMSPMLSGAASSLDGGSGLGTVTATLGRAGTLSSMSVPASWTAPSSSPVAALSDSGIPTLEGTDEIVRPGSGTTGIPGIPGGTVSRATSVVPRYGTRITVMARPPAAG